MTQTAAAAKAGDVALWRRCAHHIRDALVQAEQRVTEGFRVPPNGG